MTGLAVTASGMVTAVGLNAEASCAALRAGISGIARDNIWDMSSGEYLNVGRVHIKQWWEGPDMLAELAAPALLECLAALPRDIDREKVPIYLLLPPKDRPFREPDLEMIVLEELERRLGFNLPNGSAAYAGRTSILAALSQAKQRFKRGEATHAAIVGVDSLLRRGVVDSYIEQRRVLTEKNSNGFIPGEAACAVLVSRSGAKSAGELRIEGLGVGHEPAAVEAELPFKGDGLTAALHQALSAAGMTMAQTHYWLTDQNAEHDKAKECSVAQIRLERRLKPTVRPYQIWHPIEYLGEIGSAIGPCLLGFGLAAAKKGYAPGPLALMHVGEDDGKRAALVLRWSGRN